jgi:hypothetical protein
VACGGGGDDGAVDVHRCRSGEGEVVEVAVLVLKLFVVVFVLVNRLGLRRRRRRILQHPPKLTIPPPRRLASPARRKSVHRKTSFPTTLAKQRKTPSALLAFALDVLLAHRPPKEVVVGHSLPRLRDLSCSAERNRIEVTEDFERDLTREELDGVEAHLEVERFLEEGELRGTGDGEETAKDEMAAFRGGRGEEGPDGVNGVLLIRSEVLDGL